MLTPLVMLSAKEQGAKDARDIIAGIKARTKAEARAKEEESACSIVKCVDVVAFVPSDDTKRLKRCGGICMAGSLLFAASIVFVVVRPPLEEQDAERRMQWGTCRLPSNVQFDCADLSYETQLVFRKDGAAGERFVESLFQGSGVKGTSSDLQCGYGPLGGFGRLGLRWTWGYRSSCSDLACTRQRCADWIAAHTPTQLACCQDVESDSCFEIPRDRQAILGRYTTTFGTDREFCLAVGNYYKNDFAWMAIAIILFFLFGPIICVVSCFVAGGAFQRRILQQKDAPDWGLNCLAGCIQRLAKQGTAGGATEQV